MFTLLLSIVFINSKAVLANESNTKASSTPTKTWMEGCKSNNNV